MVHFQIIKKGWTLYCCLSDHCEMKSGTDHRGDCTAFGMTTVGRRGWLARPLSQSHIQRPLSSSFPLIHHQPNCSDVCAKNAHTQKRERTGTIDLQNCREKGEVGGKSAHRGIKYYHIRNPLFLNFSIAHLHILSVSGQ